MESAQLGTTVRSSSGLSGAGSARRAAGSPCHWRPCGEVAGDEAGATQDHIQDVGSVITCLSSTMANGADMFLGDIAKFACAHTVQAEVHHRRAGLGSKPWLASTSRSPDTITRR